MGTSNDQIVRDNLSRVGYISEDRAMALVGGETKFMHLRVRASRQHALSEGTFAAYQYLAALLIVQKRQSLRERRITTYRHKRRTIANLRRGRLVSNRKRTA